VSAVTTAPRLLHATPGLIESVWAELAPAPGRWPRSVFMGLGTVTALVLAWTLQVPSFAAPIAAFFGLLPSNVCTWRKLPLRLALTAASAILSITVAGVLVQLPWLLLPAFFAGVALVAYLCPITNAPLELLALLYPSFTAFYVGVFDPAGMPTAVGEISVAYGVGIVTATAFSRLFTMDDPAVTLVGTLAAGFASARARLDEVTARFVAERFEPVAGEAPVSSQFARDMQLLERVRQEGRHREDLTFLSLAIVVVDHALALTVTMDALARHDVGRTYRRRLASTLTMVVTRIDTALRVFEQALREHRPLAVAVATPAAVLWPEHRAAMAALESQQLALRRTGALAHVDIAEEANTDAFIRALISLAQSLQLSPADLREHTAIVTRPSTVALPRLDPYAARYGVRVGIGTTISYLIGIVADTADLFNVLWHPAFLAVSSHGATIRRAGTRLSGTVIGCLVAIIAIIAVMPNISELPALAALLFAVTVPAAYVALGGPRFSYVGVQIVVAFVIVALAEQAHPDVTAALWRVYGTLLGTAALFLAFRLVAPDYAGRQLVARFTDVVREMLGLLPGPGSVPLTVTQAAAARQRILTTLPDILRLADEARTEAKTGGVDVEAAIVAGGRAVRIADRIAAVCSGRAADPRPALSGSLQAAFEAVETAIRAWLELQRDMLQARHTMARPGSRGYRRAYASASPMAGQPRPDLSGPLRVLERTIDTARAAELAEWPPAARGALVAELEHLQRIVELLPSFDDYLTRTILPGL
jgi:uncharacterized membrane protein YccC